MKHQCSSCHQPIPRGEAVLRSVMFQVVAWCRDCAEAELVAERVA